MKHDCFIENLNNENAEKIKKTILEIEQITGVDLDIENGKAVISMGNHVQDGEMNDTLKNAGLENVKVKMDMEAMMSGKNKNQLWKELLPLWGILALVATLATIGTVFHHKGNFFHWLKDFMGVFFVIFGLLKLIKLKDFAIVYREYDLLAMKSKTYAYLYPFIEIGLGILLILNIFPFWTNIFIALIMLIGALGVYLKLRKGEKIQCACLGTVFKVPMTWVTLVEDLLMALMAIFMLAVMTWMPAAINNFSFDKLSMASQMISQNLGEGKEKKWEIGEIEKLPEVKESKIIELKDGDVYEMEAYAVKQEVGNRLVKRLSYNGMIPGPILKIPKGANITLRFKNSLGINTTLHSHGLRLDDSKFDGLPDTMGGEQKGMKPGEVFEYKLNFLDAGIFWYHPHVREDYTQEMGLYGNYHVVEENYWNKVDKENYLILDDFSENDPFYSDRVNKTLRGRFGNLMMINNDPNYILNLKQGESQRFYVTNTANTRTFKFSIEKDGQKEKLKIVGGDIGRVEKEYFSDSFILGPAERMIFETVFNEPGEYLIKSRDRILGKIVVKATDKKSSGFEKLRKNLGDYKIIEDNLKDFLSKKEDKKIRLTIGMKGMRGGGMMRGGMMMGRGEMRRGMEHKDGKGEIMGGKLEDIIAKEREMGGSYNFEAEEDGILWEEDMARMNAMSNDQMMEWKIIDETNPNEIKENMDIDWKFKKGDFVKVEIYNDSGSMHPMQHPIHFHGQRFVILERNGKLNSNFQWKDTALVRAGERMTILIQMTNPGVWMSHCHIAEHLQSGMMMIFRVEE